MSLLLVLFFLMGFVHGEISDETTKRSIPETDFRYSMKINNDGGDDYIEYIYYTGEDQWVRFHKVDDMIMVLKYTECRREEDSVFIADETQTCGDDNLFRLTELGPLDKQSTDTTQWIAGVWNKVWKSDDKRNYFYRRDAKNWIELQDNKKFSDFEEVSYNDANDSVILYSIDKKFYARLSIAYSYGDTLETVDESEMSTGRWMN